jgi:Protein of unknown function (DUF3277)
MSLPVYSSSDVNVAWGGVAIVGLAKGTFITITPNSDLTDEEVGSDGQLSISIMADRTAKVMLQLQQGSPSNQLLAAVLLDQLEGSRTFKRASLTIADPSGSVLCILTGAYIKAFPEIVMGETATGQNRTWTFFCEKVKYTSAPPGVATAVKNAALDKAAGAISVLNGILN